MTWDSFFSVKTHCLSFRKRHCLRWTISSNWWASSNVWSMACRWSWWARRAVAKRRWHLGWRKDSVGMLSFRLGQKLAASPFRDDGYTLWFHHFCGESSQRVFFFPFVPWCSVKKLPSSRLVWKAGEVPGGDAKLLPFYFGHSRRYHGCGKLRTRVGLVERRQLCDTRKGWDVRYEMSDVRWEEMRGDEIWDEDEMRWDEMGCDAWEDENMKTWHVAPY